MYFVANTLYFTAQNNDRKLGMPTTQASHKNEIWNVMYDIYIYKLTITKHQKVIRSFSVKSVRKNKKRLHGEECMSQQRNPGAQDLSFESHHRTLISAIHRIGLMLCNNVPHASGNFTLLLLPSTTDAWAKSLEMPTISAASKIKYIANDMYTWFWIVITYQND